MPRRKFRWVETLPSVVRRELEECIEKGIVFTKSGAKKRFGFTDEELNSIPCEVVRNKYGGWTYLYKPEDLLELVDIINIIRFPNEKC